MGKPTIRQENMNAIGLTRSDYAGRPSSLCRGCGHTSIANMIVSACYELDLEPEKVVKFSGIGCSSKSAAYFPKEILWIQWAAWPYALIG